MCLSFLPMGKNLNDIGAIAYADVITSLKLKHIAVLQVIFIIILKEKVLRQKIIITL